MSPRKETTHSIIEGELLIALRERSSIWQCRYKIDGVWQRTTTGERDLKKAKETAKKLYLEAQIRKENNYTPITRKFRDVARPVVKRLEKEIEAGQGKASNKDYIIALERYLIPILGKYKVDSIDYVALAKLDKARITKMRKEPTKSTLLTHNAALNRVFDLAIEKGYMSQSGRPELKAKGKRSERRVEFTEAEVRAIRGSFEKWIEIAREDSKPVRALLRDYVEALLDTGARPGKELLDLKWAQIETSVDPVLVGSSKAGPSEENQHGEDIETYDWRRTVVLNIQSGKTGKRKAIGRAATVEALTRIAGRNYGLNLPQAVEEKSQEFVFRYKEFLSKRRGNLEKEEVKFIAPTSFVKLFHNFLEEHGLLEDLVTGKERQPYSLRHTYATLMLTHDKVSPHTLAKQMGTSIAMLEKHYSHLDAVKAMHQLRGEESRELIKADTVVDKKYEYREVSKKKKKS